MTQEYLIGELSCLIGDFEPAPDLLLERALVELRREIEHGSKRELPALARQAKNFADMLCIAALEHRDACFFSCYLEKAAALEEFVICAGLVP